MNVNVPNSVRIELERILLGVRRSRLHSDVSARGLIANARYNLEYLNEALKKEPIASFLNSNGIIGVLSDFSRNDSEKAINLLGLVKINGVAGLYFVKNVDFPANRTKNDFVLVTEGELNSWSSKGFERFAELTERQMWGNMLQWLKEYRRHI